MLHPRSMFASIAVVRMSSVTSLTSFMDGFRLCLRVEIEGPRECMLLLAWVTDGVPEGGFDCSSEISPRSSRPDHLFWTWIGSSHCLSSKSLMLRRSFG